MRSVPVVKGSREEEGRASAKEKAKEEHNQGVKLKRKTQKTKKQSMSTKGQKIEKAQARKKFVKKCAIATTDHDVCKWEKE